MRLMNEVSELRTGLLAAEEAASQAKKAGVASHGGEHERVELLAKSSAEIEILRKERTELQSQLAALFLIKQNAERELSESGAKLAQLQTELQSQKAAAELAQKYPPISHI